jgi:hypothetical protein
MLFLVCKALRIKVLGTYEVRSIFHFTYAPYYMKFGDILVFFCIYFSIIVSSYHPLVDG